MIVPRHFSSKACNLERLGMDSLALQIDPRAAQVHCTDDELVVTLADARTLSVPLAWFPRLASTRPEDHAQFELLGEDQGIHWPALDEDISVLGLLGSLSGDVYATLERLAASENT